MEVTLGFAAKYGFDLSAGEQGRRMKFFIR
jgi:hypothetical protein